MTNWTRRLRANPTHALDGGIPVLFDIARAWPAASDVQRSAELL
jgi:hypothetical protein